jgi:hypothetical protein
MSVLNNLKGRKFSCILEATLAVDGRFAAQWKEFFLDGLKKLEQFIILYCSILLHCIVQ